jgi:hypothetical protein
MVEHAVCRSVTQADLNVLQLDLNNARAKQRAQERQVTQTQGSPETNCDNGNAAACRGLADASAQKGEDAYESLFLKKACNASDAPSCFRAEKLLRSVGSEASANELHEKGCFLMGMGSRCRPP